MFSGVVDFVVCVWVWLFWVHWLALWILLVYYIDWLCGLLVVLECLIVHSGVICLFLWFGFAGGIWFGFVVWFLFVLVFVGFAGSLLVSCFGCVP